MNGAETAVIDESEEWSSQLIFKFKQLERRSLKNQGLNGIPIRDLCDNSAMLYQLSHEATGLNCAEALIFSGFPFA